MSEFGSGDATGAPIALQSSLLVYGAGMWFPVALQDTRFAVRQLFHSPIITLAIVITLSLGIAANTAMLTLVNAWLVRPLPLTEPQNLVSVWRTARANPREPAYFDFYRDYLIWAAGNHTLGSLAALFPQDYTITGRGEPQQVHGAISTWNLFATVGVEAAPGRSFRADDAQGESSCVISHAFWQSHFGSSPEALGQSIQLNGQPYRVLAVRDTADRSI